MILLLAPYFEKKPWAGNKLKKYFDCPSSIGEAWIVSGYKNKSSLIINGPYKNQTLRKVFHEHEELFTPLKDKEFPLLIKLISSSDNLSVQVHPNDNYALKKHNQLGKFECWYILDDNASKEVILGLNLKNARELKSVLKNNTLEDFLLHKKIKANDLVVVKQGKVHALLKDSFVLEIQEASNITYRLYDYNREPKRELHIEDSLNVIDYNNEHNYIYDFHKENSYDNNHFSINKMIINNKLIYKNKELEVFYVSKGKGKVNEFNIEEGSSFILTFESKEQIIFEGNMELIQIIPKVKEKEMLKMRKVALITGVISQDGYYLTKLLLEKGYEVHGLVQAETQILNSIFTKYLDNENFLYHVSDMTDTSNINRILENVKPDEIYHLACQSHINLSFDLPEYTTQVNSLGTLRLLDAIKNSEIKTRLFNLSSPYLFSGEIYPQDENTPFDVQSPFAVSKLYAHKMVQVYRNNFSLYAVNGICYNHESFIRNYTTFVAPKIISAVKRIKQGENFVLELGNLDARREWGHAKDYAYAMWLILQQDKPQDYIIATGVSYTVREFVISSFKHVGIDIVFVGKNEDEIGIDKNTKKILVKVNPKLMRPNEAKVLMGNADKLYKDTNFRVKNDLDSLIESMLKGE